MCSQALEIGCLMLLEVLLCCVGRLDERAEFPIISRAEASMHT